MKKKPRLIQNIAALGSVQVANFLFPLITTPYTTRVLGVEAWGNLAFVYVILGYFTLITNWGFSWSGTRKVAAIQVDHIKLSETFFSIWAAQWILAIVSALVLVTMIFTIPYFEENWKFFAFGLFGIFTSLLFPLWFLSGLERMKQVATIQIGSKLIGIPLIFLFVKSPNDAPHMIGIGVFSSLIGGILTLLWIQKELNLICKFPSWKSIFFELKEGGALFGSTVFISIYTTLTPIILNVLSGPVAVGYYGLADKARMLVQSGLSPISQALFPRMSLLFSNDKSQARLQLLRSSKFILLLSASLSIMLWFFAEYIVILLAGEQFRPAVDVLKWLACLPFIISLSNIFGMQIMLPNQRKRAFNNILIGAGAISLIMIYPLIQWADEIGASVNTLITECFVTLAMGLYLWRKGFFKKTVNWNN